MKKNVMILLFVIPLCGFGQEVVTTDYKHFEIIANKIDSVIRSVLYPKINSIDCNLVQDNDFTKPTFCGSSFCGDSLIVVHVRVNLDSTGKFHIAHFKIGGNCIAKMQYIEDKREEIVSHIESMDPLLIFYYEKEPDIWEKDLTKEELFKRMPYLQYQIPVFIKY
ncbi:MAG: hypothetical protein J5873_02685 [Bacteroidales bacterium]|nr:hypothetical protein [Bacteroidales bacterium]